MLENMVHPCREDYLLIAMSTVMDVQTYILILYNYKWILEICGSGIAFSQEVEEGPLGINVTTCLFNTINFYSFHVQPECCLNPFSLIRFLSRSNRSGFIVYLIP